MWSTWQQEEKRLSCILHPTDYIHSRHACIDQVWTEPRRNMWSSCKWFEHIQNRKAQLHSLECMRIRVCKTYKYRVWKIQALRHCRSLYMCRTVYFMHWGRQRSCVPGIWGKEEYTCLGDHATLWSAAPDRRGGAALAAARGGEGRVPAFPLGHARCTWKKKNSGKDKKGRILHLKYCVYTLGCNLIHRSMHR